MSVTAAISQLRSRMRSTWWSTPLYRPLSRHRVWHREGRAALTRLAGGSDDLVGGIAAALGGDGARASQHLNDCQRPISIRADLRAA